MASDQDTDQNASEPAPGEPLSPAMRQRLQKCYKHGASLTARTKYNFDYADDMFSQCAANDPGNLVYVEAFLDNLQRKFKDNKKGSLLRGFGGKGNIKKLVAKKDWPEVFKQGPVQLKTNPWDVTTLRALAEACEAYGFWEVELRYLKNALDGNPKDAETNRHCAKALGRQGHFDQAIACWHRVEELKRGDPEAPKMISEISMAKARGAAGIDDDDENSSQQSSTSVKPQPSGPAATPTPRPAQPAEQKTDSGPQKRREIPLTPRQKLEREIQEFPTDVDLYLALADLLTEEGRHGDAELTLNKALAVAGNDTKVLEKLDQARMDRARLQVKVAEQQAVHQKTSAGAELAAQLRADMNRLELEIYNSRCERHPEDSALRFELGIRLKRCSNFAEAIKTLQQARSDPRQKPAATLEMGECCQQLKQYKQALECYKRAVELYAGGDENKRKLALYRAGVLAVGLKELDLGEKFLSELAGVDSSYKDVSARLDKIRQIRDKE